MALTRLQPAALQPSAFSGLNITDGSLYPVDLSSGAPQWTSGGSVTLGNATASTWDSNAKTLEFPQGALMGYGTTSITLYQNAYLNASTVNTYKQSSIAAGSYQIASGAHTWRYAASGTAGNPITFTTQMVLDTSGNLGLGVTPSAWSGATALQMNALSIYNATANYSYIGHNVYVGSLGNTYKMTGLSFAQEIGQQGFKWYGAPSGTINTAINGTGNFNQLMGLDTNGNLALGSGTTASTTRLTVTQSADGDGIRLNHSGRATGTHWKLSLSGVNNEGLNFAQYNGVTELSTYVAGRTFHIWNINGTQYANIDSSGNLLIGPNTTAADNSSPGIKLFPSYASSGAPEVAAVSSTSNTSYGCWYMYSTADSQYKFYVNWAGSVYARSTSITGLSDISEKENIKPLETGLTEVMALQPRRFDWKNGTGTNVAGFVAQEVELVLPDLVDDYESGTEDPKKGLKMGDMIPTLVKAIQEQQAIIESLKSRLDAAGL